MRTGTLGISGLSIALLAACTSATPPPADAASDITTDLTAPADAADATVDAKVLPPWPHELPAASAMGSPRGLTTARVIVHSHSVHSHDACDGNPYVDGGPNEPCLQSFRRAMCRARIDAVFLTEHAGLMAEGSFERVMQTRAGDEPVMEGGALVGYWTRCDDGHRTLWLPGAENELMPLGLRRHPDRVNGSLDAAYHADDAAGAQRFREAGALVAVAHVEQRSIEELRAVRPDIVEVYNVHANLAPNIALQANPVANNGQALVDTLRFIGRSNPLEPDLAFLAFFAENTSDLGKWAQLWGDGRNVPGVAASDAHENTFTAVMSDGERGDSYRRIFRFFSNEVLVRGALTRESVMASLARGSAYVAFEALGTPVGFSCAARTRDGMSHEMGSTVRMADAPSLVLRGPALHAPLAGAPTPRVEMRVYRAEGDRWTMAQRWEDPAAMGDIQWVIPAAGVYRVEVRMVPEHARAYLPGMEQLVRDVPWIYGNPIRVE
jgi:hypothetical protein